MITRQHYIDSLIAYRDKPIIKITAGMRRSGKSTIMAYFHNYLVQDGVPQKNIISISFETMEFDEAVGEQDLYELIKSKQPVQGKCYLLLDEVQMVKNWEKAISRLYEEDSFDIYLTVSNSFLKDSDCAISLAGRYVMINVLPLSFQEYLHFILCRRQEDDRQYNSLRRMSRKFMNQGENLELDLKRYVRYGGLPAMPFIPPQSRVAEEFLEGVYNSVIVKDVLINENIRDLNILQKIVRYLAQNTGKIISPAIVSSYLDIYNPNGNHKEDIAADYLLMLEKAYIFYKLCCFDIAKGTILPNLNKYYVVDTGIRNMILSFSDTGRGHNLETIVYFELLRRGYQVFCGQYDGTEIDFYAARQEERKCFQVIANLDDAEAGKQKITALANLPVSCEKVVITKDKGYRTTDKGIIFLNYADFLLNSDS
ncbi:MAG: ATP-binding protein [Acidaminococcaceae bacterium]